MCWNDKLLRMSISTSQSQHVLVDAKEEFVAQLVSMITSPLYLEFQRIYSFGKHESDPIKAFQENLSRIPRWTPNNIERHYQQIQKQNDCDWVDKLITAVFVSHAKVLSSIRGPNSRQLSVPVPPGKTFIHRCYIEAARQFWKRPDLLYHKYNKLDLQRNMHKSEKIISKSIRQTVRKMLPVKTILEEYLDKSEIHEESYCEDNISEAMSVSDKKNLKKLVSREVESASLVVNPHISDDTFSKYKIDCAPMLNDVQVEDITSTEMYPDNKGKQQQNDETQSQVQELSSIYMDLASEVPDPSIEPQPQAADANPTQDLVSKSSPKVKAESKTTVEPVPKAQPKSPKEVNNQTSTSAEQDRERKENMRKHKQELLEQRSKWEKSQVIETHTIVEDEKVDIVSSIPVMSHSGEAEDIISSIPFNAEISVKSTPPKEAQNLKPEQSEQPEQLEQPAKTSKPVATSSSNAPCEVSVHPEDDDKEDKKIVEELTSIYIPDNEDDTDAPHRKFQSCIDKSKQSALSSLPNSAEEEVDAEEAVQDAESCFFNDASNYIVWCIFLPGIALFVEIVKFFSLPITLYRKQKIQTNDAMDYWLTGDSVCRTGDYSNRRMGERGAQNMERLYQNYCAALCFLWEHAWCSLGCPTCPQNYAWPSCELGRYS